MNVILAIAVGAVAVEIFLRTPLIGAAKRLLAITGKAKAVMMSRMISDHWKERVLLVYARQIAVLSLKLTCLLLALAVILGSIAFGFDLVLGGDFVEFIVGPLGLVVTTAASVAYYFARSRFVAR